MTEVVFVVKYSLGGDFPPDGLLIGAFLAGVSIRLLVNPDVKFKISLSLSLSAYSMFAPSALSVEREGVAVLVELKVAIVFDR